MPTLREVQLKQAAIKKAKDDRAIQAAQDARKAALRERRTNRAIRLKMRDMLGDTLLDADLTPQEHAVIAGILARRKDTPSDWELLADWMPRPVRHKLDKPDPVRDAAE